MAQGNLKLKATGPKKAAKKLLTPKKAAPKIIKPKKSSAKQHSKLTKVQQGHLMNSTELLIAGRVGHLELIKGSRRQIEKEEKAKAKAGKK